MMLHQFYIILYQTNNCKIRLNDIDIEKVTFMDKFVIFILCNGQRQSINKFFG